MYEHDRQFLLYTMIIMASDQMIVMPNVSLSHTLLTAILCHVTITWWEAIITVYSKRCWSFSYVRIHSVYGFVEIEPNVQKWKAPF